MMTARKQAFVDHMLTCHNATKAAQMAGYSAKTAKQAGSRLLSDVDVQATITQAQQEAAHSAGVTLQRIIEEFAKLAFTDLTSLVSWRGQQLTIKDAAELTPAECASLLEVAEAESKSGRSLLKVKLYSKQAALESLLKCLQALDLEARVKALEEAVLHQRNGHPWR
jgi:phage terminase small subunit